MRKLKLQLITYRKRKTYAQHARGLNQPASKIIKELVGIEKFKIDRFRIT